MYVFKWLVIATDEFTRILGFSTIYSNYEILHRFVKSYSDPACRERTCVMPIKCGRLTKYENDNFWGNITVKCLWTFGQGRCVVNAGSGSVLNPVPSTTTNPQPQPQVWKVSEEGLVQVYKGCSYTMMMPRMLQQHSDIKVTDAAGINHIGKVYCGNFDCKTESKADEWNQTLGYSQSLLCSLSKNQCLSVSIFTSVSWLPS